MAPGQIPPGQIPPGQFPPGQFPSGPPLRGWQAPAPVARPGAVPLRPLRLGDLVDGAVRIVRRNAAATVGAALLASVLTLLLPLAVTAGTSMLADLSSWDDPDVPLGDTEAVLLGITLASWLLGVLLQTLATILVAGMCAHVTAAAVLGRTMTMAEAWRATHGQRWRLVGAAVVTGTAMLLLVVAYVVLVVVASLTGGWPAGISVGLLGGAALLAALSWVWVRLQLVVTPVIALEGQRVFAALSRSSSLTKGYFWRLLGIMLLVTLVLQIIAGMVSLPVTILALLPSLTGAGSAASFFAEAAGQGISLVLTTALVTPFSATLGALLHVDLRMRKEAFDVELLQRAGARGE